MRLGLAVLLKKIGSYLTLPNFFESVMDWSSLSLEGHCPTFSMLLLPSQFGQIGP